MEDMCPKNPLLPEGILVRFRIAFSKKILWRSRHGAAETHPTRNDEVLSSIPGLAQFANDQALP